MAKIGSQNKIVPAGRGQSGAIGIDLGTTYSSVGVWQHGRVEIIANQKGNQTTPSCVTFTKTGHLIGDEAKSQIGLDPANTIYATKRLLGRSFSDAQVQADMKHWPFKVVAGLSKEDEQKPMIVVTDKGEEKQFSAEDISSMVLIKMKEIAESYLDSKVTNAVVAVPAHFNHLQYKATKDACVLAGLNVVRLINEPIAAAVAYAFNREQTSDKPVENILVFDYGGGALDVSVIAIDKNVFQIKANSVNPQLGGENIDDRMVGHFAEEFKRKHGKDIAGDSKALARLRNSCERAKRELSSVRKTSIEMCNFFENIDFFATVTYSLIEKLSADLLNSCMDSVSKCMKNAKMTKDNIDTVLLVGGSSRIPMVQQMLQDFFKEKRFYKNSDDAVTYGAAILSEMWSAESSVNSKLFGVAPLSLGVEVYGGGMSVVIPKDTETPTKKTKVYTTVHDNQTIVKFSIYEGEDSVAKNNNFLDEFRLTDIPPAPARSPKFDVSFDINGDGILTVSSEHRGTTNKKDIKITNFSVALLEGEQERMLEEARNSKAKVESGLMKPVKTTNNNLVKFAGGMMKFFQKKFKHLGVLNCFDIRD